MLNPPKYYNLFLITETCKCGETYIQSDMQLARSIPNGVAYSPVKTGDTLWDIPINKKEVNRAIPYCVMCVDKAERTPVPVPQAGVYSALGRTKPEPKEITLDLKALGLI